MTEPLAIGLFCLFVLSLQTFATLRIRKSPSFEREQKRAQFKLIWLLPIIGAAMVLAILHQDGELLAGRPDKHQGRGT